MPQLNELEHPFHLTIVRQGQLVSPNYITSEAQTPWKHRDDTRAQPNRAKTIIAKSAVQKTMSQKP